MYAAPVETREQAIALLGRYCDVEERITLIPPSAKSRGLYFRSIESVVADAGEGEQYRRLFPERFAAVMWYPASEFLVRLVVAGALLASPERVQEGMFEIGRRNAVAFSESLLGRAMLRLLSRDPKRLLHQGAAARRQSSSFGHWDLCFPDGREAIVDMREEYMYIESYLLGAARGTFDAIGIAVDARCELDTRFSGRHLLSW